jgi:excisionase family DNA binding protein
VKYGKYADVISYGASRILEPFEDNHRRSGGSKNSPISRQTSVQDSPLKKLLKTKEVCELFQVSKPTIYEWLKQGKLKSIKIGSRRYFLWQDIEELIQRSGDITGINNKSE